MSMHRATLPPLSGTDALLSFTLHSCKSGMPRKADFQKLILGTVAALLRSLPISVGLL
jgi:hypothetical protein